MARVDRHPTCHPRRHAILSDLLATAFLSIPLIGAFVLFTIGIVAIYRASRVLNLAHGAMAVVPAYVEYSLVQAGLHPLVGLPIAVLSGVLLGIAVERLFVRRLRPQGPTAQTVGTVAVTGLVTATLAKVYGTSALRAPTIFPEGTIQVGDVATGFGEVGLLVVGLGVGGAVFAYFRFTGYGLAMRGAAVNRAAAGLMGIDADRAALVAWGLGGGLAAIAGVLLAAVTTLDPFTLSLQVLPAFVAGLVGGLESFVGALIGSVVVALTFGLVPILADVPVIDTIFVQSGAPQFALTVLALVVMAVRGRRVVGVEAAEAGLTAAARQRRTSGVSPWALLAVGVLLVWPLVVPFSVEGATLIAFEFTIAAVSLVVLTGWVGQISLAQGTFVGIGAFSTSLFTSSLGIGFPANVVVGAAVAGVVAVALGAVALRVRGLYLAVATLIFAWMGETFLFRSPWLGASGGSTQVPPQTIGIEGTFPYLDLTSRTVLYYVMLAVVVLVLATVANLPDTRTGRAFFAVRGSEMAASSVGIDVTRVKLVAFGLAGVLAGISGSLLMIELQVVSSEEFFVAASLQFLAIAVVGGLTSLGGAVAAGILFASLNVIFFTFPIFSGLLLLVSSGLLAFVLLVAPGGLAAIPDQLRNRWQRRRARARAQQMDTGGGDLAGPASEGADEEPALDAADTQVIRVPDGEDTDDGADLAATARLRQRAAASSPVRVAGHVGTAVRATGRRLAAPVAAARQRRRALKGVPDRPDDWVSEGKQQADDLARGLAPSANGDEPARRGATGPLAEVLESGVHRELPADRSDRRPLVEALDITVQFGGLRAVDDATLEVREGEIVGLIGPNGAGKTTLFNAILGLNDPRDGVVRLYGGDVSHLRPHLRARLGVARTFQVIQLFEQLSVFDNLLVATHLHNDAGLVSNLFAGSGTLAAEQQSRQRVHDVLQLLGLDDVADESVQNLPFGVLRMVELGRALVTGAKILMLDEAASGLNDTETAWLVEIVRRVRSLGVSVLLIEHDVPMVCGVADFVYVLDQGKIIAADTPAAIQRDPDVIAAYIGGADEDATPDDVAAAADEPADEPGDDGGSPGRVRRRVIRRDERDEEDIVAAAYVNPNGTPERDPAGRRAR